MKDFFKYFCLLFLVVFSFYYTDKISNLLIYKSSLMKKIIQTKSAYEQNAVNAVIDGNYIIPGLNGISVNEKSSYYQMKSNQKFDSSLFVFNQISPQISITNNDNLIIKKGNSLKKAVAIIIDTNQKAIDYFEKEKIIYNSLNDIKINNKIEMTYEVDNEMVYEVSSGDIIFINNNLTLNNIKYLLKKIKYRDLKIITLEDLLSEQRDG